MQQKRLHDTYVLKLERGEKVLETIARFVGESGVEAGLLSGIGAVRDATLGYFDPQAREYVTETFEESMEVASLAGNVGRLEGKPILHVHATLAGRDHTTRAGHLFSAVVSATLEVFITALPGEIKRARDEDTGLNLMDLR